MAYLSLAAVLNEMNRAASDSERALDLSLMQPRFEREQKAELDEEAEVSEMKSSSNSIGELLKSVTGGGK